MSRKPKPNPPPARTAHEPAGGANQLGSSPAPGRENKINLIGTIILFGFALSWFYYYYLGTYLRLPYPKNTFLFFPGAGFSDFVNSAAHVHDRNPYFIRSIAPSNYYPFGNVHSWLFTALLPLRTSHFVFLAVFLSGTVLLCRYYLRTSNKVDFARNVFVYAFLTYPVLFNIDRSNFECILFLYLALFILFFVQKRYLLSGLFLSFAIAMKAYPVIFLLLFISEKRYREVSFCIFTVIFLTFAGLLFHKGGYVANLNFMLSGFSSVNYITNQENIVQRSMSLFTLLKMLLIWSGLIKTVTVASLVLPYYAIMAAVGGLIAIYVLFIEGELWKKVGLLTFACLLFPHVSADYKLIHLFLPLFLFLNSPGEFKHDKEFTWLFGLLLMPKSYYYFESIVSDSSTNDISMAVPLNIIILTLMTMRLLADGLGGLRAKLPAKDFKLKLWEYLELAKQYTVHLLILGIIAGALLVYVKFGMKDYKEASKALALSQMLCEQRKYAEALAVCDKLIAENRGSADVYCVVSSAKIGLKQWEEAARAAEKALALAPDFEAAQRNLYTANTSLTPRGTSRSP